MRDRRIFLSLIIILGLFLLLPDRSSKVLNNNTVYASNSLIDKDQTFIFKVSGWNKVNGKWYYVNPINWKPEIGWKKYKNKWYYLNLSTGAMKTGWTKINSKWYYLDHNTGEMLTDWHKINNRWYHFDNFTGAMKTGWLDYLNWYYLDPYTGAMKTGWAKIDNKWYFLDRNTGELQIGYYIVNNNLHYSDSSGKWIRQENSSKVTEVLNKGKKAALDYIVEHPSSRLNLIYLVRREDISSSLSAKIVDELRIDWVEQIIRLSETYLERYPTSKDSYSKYLMGEGNFSRYQVETALRKMNIDWNEHAYRVAKDYLKYHNADYNELLNIVLIGHHSFTPCEATYGVEKVLSEL